MEDRQREYTRPEVLKARARRVGPGRRFLHGRHGNDPSPGREHPEPPRLNRNTESRPLKRGSVPTPYKSRRAKPRSGTIPMMITKQSRITVRLTHEDPTAGEAGINPPPAPTRGGPKAPTRPAFPC